MGSKRHLLSVAVLVTVFFCGVCMVQFSEGKCLEGFVNASNLPNTSQWVPAPYDEVLKFPNIKFNCRGNITGYRMWTTVGNRRGNWGSRLSIHVYVGDQAYTISHNRNRLGQVIEGNLAVPIQVTTTGKPFRIHIPQDPIYIPIAFVVLDGKFTNATTIARDCKADRGRHCNVKPLIEFTFVPEPQIAPTTTVRTAPPMTAPPMTSIAAVLSSSVVTMSTSENVTALSSNIVASPSSAMLSESILPSASMMSNSSTFDISSPPSMEETDGETSRLLIIIIVSISAGLVVCILLLLMCIAIVKIKSRRNMNRVTVEELMMESSCNKKNEIHYNEPNSLPNKQQDNLSDTPSITGLVDTGSPCGTMTTEENSPVTARELPPPPSSASSDKKATNAKEASILESNRSSEVYDKPETNITAVTSKVSVEYAEPEVIHRGEAKVENEYDDPEDFYYYNLPNGQMELRDKAKADELSKLSLVVPTLEERVRVFPKNDDWQKEGIYAIYKSIAKQKSQDSVTPPTSEDHYSIPLDCEEAVYKTMSEFSCQELPRPLVKIGRELGCGQYGRVHKGIWVKDDYREEVAMKILCNRRHRLHFLQEAAIMGQFSHRNILKLHGMVTLVKPMMMVMELAEKGTLKNYLTKMRESLGTPDHKIHGNELLNYSCQVAEGMKFLEEKGFVHRNISASNVLLDRENTCKISGFVPNIHTTNNAHVTKRDENSKLRWTAPEALVYGKYTCGSDVWSYGMLLYEIWSVGRTPFEAMSYSQVLSVINTGYCQPPPPGCPREMYSIMVQCWNPEYRKRPTFGQICEKLEDLLPAISELSEAQDPSQQLGSPPEEGMCLFMDLQKSYS